MSALPSTTSAPAAAGGTATGTTVLLLALLLGIQPITTDLYLPALPMLTAALGASMAQAQLTLTALLLAFGCSQLVWGPLSDRFGRRPVLLAGLAAYTLAAVGALLAPSIGWLIAWRALQGAGMGAAVVGARAMIRDGHTPAEGARVMARALGGLGLLACASVPVGGLLADWAGWRAALGAVAVFGALTALLVATRFAESLRHANPHALRPAMLVRTWWRIARNPTFGTFTLLNSASYAGLFTFLAASSFTFIGVLGASRGQYAMAMFSMAIAYIAGTLLCRRLAPRIGLRRSIACAAWVTLAGGSAMGLLALAGVRSTWALLLPFWLFMVGHGIHQPCGNTGSVGPFPEAAGAAAALNGFIGMLVAFGVGAWLGWRMDGTVFPLANGIWLWSCVIAATAWTLVQRHGDPAAVRAGAPAAAEGPA